MARVSSVEPCMFCGQLPCGCNAKKAKPKSSPRTKKPAAPTSEPSLTVDQTVEVESKPVSNRQSMVERMRARAASSPVPPPSPVRARPKVAPDPELSNEEFEMLPAIRALSDEFIIAKEDIAPWRKYLEKPPSARERALTWKSKVNRKNGPEGGPQP